MAHRSSILAQKLSAFLALSRNEQACLEELEAHPINVKCGREIVEEGQTGHIAYILRSGWACSYKLLPDGGRQIIGFPIAGDCVGLRSVLLHTSDHSFSALTDAELCGVETSRMLSVFSEFPRLATAILWAASRDEAMVVEHLVSVGRRNAIERTAHFFLELHERLGLVGLANGTEFLCPLNQYVLADALGLTAIHVNRVLRQLREAGLLTVKGRKVTIEDAGRMRSLAGFEPQETRRNAAIFSRS
jgi:CRP-like cAMP-binding protein